jgi:hypothetical protein
MTDSTRFEGLGSTIKYSWREDIKAALILEDLWSAVEEDAMFNAFDAPEKRKVKEKATALLQVKMSSDSKHLVTRAASAKAAWKALKATFKAQSVRRKADLRQQLKELRRKKTKAVLIYISRAEILRTELKDACNATVPDDAFIHYTLDEGYIDRARTKNQPKTKEESMQLTVVTHKASSNQQS